MLQLIDKKVKQLKDIAMKNNKKNAKTKKGSYKKDIDLKDTYEENAELADFSVQFSKKVLDDFKKNVGRYPAETGGMLASSSNEKFIDVCYFDKFSKNSSSSFYYDVDSMSKVFRKWKSKGYITNGIYHSHPLGSTHPSYHDISSSWVHMKFFEIDYFYLPIIQSNRKSEYTLFLYVVKKEGENLIVTLNYVLKAIEEEYKYISFNAFEQSYSIAELETYNARVNKKEKEESNKVKNIQNVDYFKKIRSIYPEHVLKKVIVCIGLGGTRSLIENFARSGFFYFILIDKDIVSPSNVATQGVFVSEVGKKKVEVAKDRILDINPEAQVVCVDKFLDDNMTDEEFKSYLDLFEGKKATDYLILGCTDNFNAQKRSSILALKYGIPYLAAMMYKNGSAAEIIFNYPGVTPCCPRCLLRSRFEAYENGFENDVDSSGVPIFATERMNSLKGYIALMLLLYHEDPSSPFNDMLEAVKDRNFVWIRLNPNLQEDMGISFFDKVLEGAKRYTYMDETLWIPQVPDTLENSLEACLLCGGSGDLSELYMKWPDTRAV